VRSKDTVIYDAGTHPELTDDERVIVSMKDRGCEILLFFDDLAVEPPVREVRLRPAFKTKPFEPWRLMRELPLYLVYARAEAAFQHDNADAALRELRRMNRPGRGFDERFLRSFADRFNALVEAGERYPSKAFAETYRFDKAQVSRWLKAAREADLIKERT
jgi:hypothetical protein